ncbi:MAG: hydroxyacylglutathione hydrolase [Bdellovibrionales bacterium]|nr:hydroxyacylglutathione hydrolase [Bdellovibrionales bacterium]
MKDNFIYVLTSEDGQQATVIDPGEAAPVLKFLRAHSLHLTHILCTHHHHDHVGGVAELVDAYKCAVIGSQKDFDLNRIPRGTLAVSEQKPLKLWGRSVHILDVPGHTLGQICYYFEPEQMLFPGDTLFSAGCGRLFEGTPEQMFISLRKIAALPASTKIYFGHEYTLHNLDFVQSREDNQALRAYREHCEKLVARGEPTSPSQLSTELAINPFLRAPDVATFAETRAARDHF